MHGSDSDLEDAPLEENNMEEHPTEDRQSDENDEPLEFHTPPPLPRSLMDTSPRVRFGSAKWRNLGSLLLFGAVTLVVFVLEAVDLEEYPTTTEVTFIMILSCFLSAGVAVLCLCVWVWVSDFLIWIIELSSLACVFLFSFFLFTWDDGSWQGGLVFLLVGLLMCVWLWDARSRGKLQFAGVMLEMISKLIRDNHSLLTVTGVILFVQIAWLALFSLAAIQATLIPNFDKALYLLLAFIFYWTVQVFKHVLHVCVAGTISHWYHKLQPVGGPRGHITSLCLRRALSTQLGSICLGSFFVAALRSIWAPLRAGLDARNCLLICLFDKVFLLVESLHERFNKFGFVSVILYGDDFKDASRSTWHRMVDKGIDCIVMEDKVDILLLFPAIGGGSFVACFAGSFAYYCSKAVDPETTCALDDPYHWTTVALCAFWVGFATVSLTTEVVEAVSTTVYSCFAEEPESLAETNPLIFHRFVRISEFSTFRSRRLDSTGL